MGFKNVKTHYKIQHIVQMREGVLCVGSSYVSELLMVSPDGIVTWGNLGPSSNDDLARYHSEMTADRAKLVELLTAPDMFDKSITVYTYRGGEIIEKLCETPKWPNATHDGELMYDNTFSTSKKKVVERAKRNAACGIELMEDSVERTRKELAEREESLAQDRADLAKLEADFPTEDTR